jgi:hypothetical protein
MKKNEVKVVEWKHEYCLKCDGLKAAQLAPTVLRSITVFSSANSSSDPEPPSANWVFKLHRKFT